MKPSLRQGDSLRGGPDLRTGQNLEDDEATEDQHAGTGTQEVSVQALGLVARVGVR